MKNDQQPDLTSLSVDDLVRGVEAVPLAVRNSVETWAVSEGYYPGTKRVLAQVLHDKYLEWFKKTDQPGRPFDIRSFGKVLSRLFKRGKSKLGSHYYISRESDSELGRKLAEAGKAPRGG